MTQAKKCFLIPNIFTTIPRIEILIIKVLYLQMECFINPTIARIMIIKDSVYHAMVSFYIYRSDCIIVNFEIFFRIIQVGNCVRLFSKKNFLKLRRLIFKNIYKSAEKKIIKFKMRRECLLFNGANYLLQFYLHISTSTCILAVQLHSSYVYQVLQVCTTNLAILITAVSGIVRLLIKFLQYCPVRLLTLVRLLSPAGN